jgi:hypothetical protein
LRHAADRDDLAAVTTLIAGTRERATRRFGRALGSPAREWLHRPAAALGALDLAPYFF